MADTKISALTEETAPVTTDEVAIVDDPTGTPATKRATIANLSKGINASNIATGTLKHEQGGLEADVSAYGGLVKISAGSTSQAAAGTDYQGVLAEGAFVDGDKTKLDGIETAADVTDEANVTDALDGATLTDLGTPADTDLVLLQDASDSNILKVAQASTLGGGGGLANVVEDTTPQLGGELDENEKGVYLAEPEDLSGDHTFAGITTKVPAAQVQNFGDVVYIDANGRASIANATNESTSRVFGICVSASVAASAQGTYMLQGMLRDDSLNLSNGGLMYLTNTGTTGNTLSQTTGSQTRVVGVAMYVDGIYFNPNLNV